MGVMKGFALAVGAVMLCGCATQPPIAAGGPNFFLGLFHGLVALPALIGSVFLPIHVYAFPNDGFGYELGFLMGFAASILLIVLSVMARVGGLFVRRG